MQQHEMDRLYKIEQELDVIKQRNLRVEADKAWETSFFCVITITLLTYLVTAFIFYGIGITYFWLNALIPSIGFFISVQSLPFIKRWWIKRYFRK
jgi:hypothetical protein